MALADALAVVHDALCLADNHHPACQTLREMIVVQVVMVGHVDRAAQAAQASKDAVARGDHEEAGRQAARLVEAMLALIRETHNDD